MLAIYFAIFMFNTNFAQSSSCLEILPNPDVSSPAFQEFDRYIEVLGVLKFYAEPGVSDAKLIHAGIQFPPGWFNARNSIIKRNLSLSRY